jgi:hypothetical protein
MLVNGLWFGLFLIACGVITVYPTLGKKGDELVSFGRYGGLAEARVVRIFGEVIIAGGLLVLSTSLLWGL